MKTGTHKLDLVVVALASTTERKSHAAELAKRFAAQCVERVTATTSEYRLYVTDDRVELCAASMKPGSGAYVDLSTLDRRTMSRSQPIAKAMGKGTRTVIDATAGMGQDAFLLACLGYDVTAIERSPVIAALLEDGLRRALADQLLTKANGDRLRIVHGDAIPILKAMANVPNKPDAVYLDPMYPPKRKASALPKMEIQILRAVVGDDPDAADLFDAAMRAASKRVIVKRPLHAPPLAPDPAASHKGKLARFDVYPTKR